MFWLQVCEVVVTGLVAVVELAFDVHNRPCVVVGVITTRGSFRLTPRDAGAPMPSTWPLCGKRPRGGSTTCHTPLRASATYVADVGAERLFVQELRSAEDRYGNSRVWPIRAYFGLGRQNSSDLIGGVASAFGLGFNIWIDLASRRSQRRSGASRRSTMERQEAPGPRLPRPNVSGSRGWPPFSLSP
jgi:hypothetical protein